MMVCDDDDDANDYVTHTKGVAIVCFSSAFVCGTSIDSIERSSSERKKKRFFRVFCFCLPFNCEYEICLSFRCERGTSA